MLSKMVYGGPRVHVVARLVARSADNNKMSKGGVEEAVDDG